MLQSSFSSQYRGCLLLWEGMHFAVNKCSSAGLEETQNRSKEWLCFSAKPCISSKLHPVSSAIQISFYLFCFFLCIPFPLHLFLFFLLLASPLPNVKKWAPVFINVCRMWYRNVVNYASRSKNKAWAVIWKW